MQTERAPQILIADDQGVIRSLLRLILREEGFEVIGEAADGEEAIRQVEALRPDIVCLDINMPRLDGIGTLKRLRESGNTTRVIMISSSATGDNVKQALAAGANGFIVKPFNADQVTAAIRRCVAQR